MSLNDYVRVDDQDDVMAEHVNIPTVSTLRGELGEALAITAQLALTDGDFPYLEITPDADYDVLLPPEASTNHVHILKNASGTYTLTVKEDSDTTTIETLGPGAVGMFIPSLGTGWDVIKTISNPAASERVHTQIDGLKLTWNSATSIDVGVGACYAENGDWIDVTSAITKAALSLSSSTWYHVYVYLNSGTPAAEVVTTAPVAWKGTAFSKTGDTSRRYVGSIRTDGSGNVYEFLHIVPSVMLYVDAPRGSAPFRIVSSGAATTVTPVDISAVVPITAIAVNIQSINTSDVTARLGSTSALSSTYFDLLVTAGNTVNTSVIGNVAIKTTQTIYYVLPSRTTGVLNVDVMGYQFER